MEAKFCEAIRDQLLVEFLYKGSIRRVEPHAVGYDTKGHLTLSGWQLSGGSGQDWRDFHLSLVSQVVVLTQRFAGPREGYNRNDKTLTRVVCQL